MKKTIKSAIEAHDIPKIRSLVLEMLTKRADSRGTIETVTYAVENVPDLFEKDNGKVYPDLKTETLCETLYADLTDNFSGEKLRLFVEACVSPAPTEIKSHKSSKCAKIIGYIMMALGAAAAIVALCVPLRFLLGIGIGVVMIGSAVTYLNIRS